MANRNWLTRSCMISLLWGVAAFALPAQTFTKLSIFNGTNGNNPLTALVQGPDGDLYGTTSGGGANFEGTVFKINTSGRAMTLYSFCPVSGCPDGEVPQAPLVLAKGNFYGTTLDGGTGGPCVGNQGCGVIFKVSPSGQFATVYSFCSQINCTDGEFPPLGAGLVQGNDGSLYGVTLAGGFTSGCPAGCGTVFRLTLAGSLSTIYNFCSASECADGIAPLGGLMVGRDGNFYGTTTGGGSAGRGVVYKLTPGGVQTVLYSFCSLANCADGYSAAVGVAQGRDGNFYGSTREGGAFNFGTLFQLTPGGQLTTLTSFCSQGGCAGGIGPSALIQATDGNLYGTTPSGSGTMNAGTIFEITPAGSLTTLYNFCSQRNCTDGENPMGALVQDTNGTFYGTTSGGGSVFGSGITYSLNTGLGAFVEANPAAGRTGATVTILGTSLTGATSVTFNGVAAVFNVTSSSEVTTTVPAGATTGTVRVTTPSGTLTSNAPFRVLP
jgi:uncharacterized repeat protein (TIGR03803 family)